MTWVPASELAAWDHVYLTPNGELEEVLVTVTGIRDCDRGTGCCLMDIYGVGGGRPVEITLDADTRVRTTD
jgi:hypothetical protein